MVVRKGGPIYERAKSVVKNLLQTAVTYQKFSRLLYLKFDIVKWMSRRMRSRNEVFKGKVHLLEYHWNQVLDKFSERATELNHQKGLTLANALHEIPKEVRNYVLVDYVRHTQLMNGIYFFA